MLLKWNAVWGVCAVLITILENCESSRENPGESVKGKKDADLSMSITKVSALALMDGMGPSFPRALVGI